MARGPDVVEEVRSVRLSRSMLDSHAVPTESVNMARIKTDGEDLFFCYYCGLNRPLSEASTEHIIPQCIGGNRGTVTDRVCKGCNSSAGERVDRPFGRDWFIQAARVKVNFVHKGKPSAVFQGFLLWQRPETVAVLSLRGSTMIFSILGSDAKEYVCVAVNEQDREAMRDAERFCRREFKGARVVNDTSPHSPYENELATALVQLGSQFRVKREHRLLSWDREIVKIALGLSCKVLGEDFVQSPRAGLLRQFLWEESLETRADIPLRGSAGITAALGPSLAIRVAKSPHEHAFALMSMDDRIVFWGRLFGQYENWVEVDSSGDFCSRLPGNRDRGVCWVINSGKKSTLGPVPLEDFLIG